MGRGPDRLNFSLKTRLYLTTKFKLPPSISENKEEVLSCSLEVCLEE